jgi:predicted metalloprotease with PDZ domain
VAIANFQLRAEYVIHTEITGDGDGETFLELPDEWAGESDLHNGISDVTALSDDTSIEPAGDPANYRIIHEPGAEVRVRYRLAQDWDGVPMPGEGNPYRPVVQEDYVHLIGWTAWALPRWDEWPGENQEVDFRLDWSGMPVGWSVVGNFGAGRTVRETRSPLNRLQSGLFVAGDFRILTRQTGAAPLHIAIRGDWPFEDNQFADQFAEVVIALREFWREERDDPYLVTLIPLTRAEGDEGHTSWGGTGLVDSFALFATTNVGTDDFQRLAAHEFQHRWTPSELGTMADPEEALYWFSEGFTEYYTSLLLLRAGLIDLEAFVADINSTLRDYYRSPAREAPVDQVVDWFWSDGDLQTLPYLRGHLLAHRRNAALKDVSDGEVSLDTVLFDLLEAGQAARAAGEPRQISSRDIVEAVAAYDVTGAENDHRSFITQGGMVPIEAGMFGPCLDVRDADFPLWDLGFDVEASFEARAVTGVRVAGPAWNAGLRDDMPFGGWSIPNFGDPETDATIFVGIDGEVVPIIYKPQGDVVETIPQAAFTADMSTDDRAACLAWLGVN